MAHVTGGYRRLALQTAYTLAALLAAILRAGGLEVHLLAAACRIDAFCSGLVRLELILLHMNSL